MDFVVEVCVALVVRPYEILHHLHTLTLRHRVKKKRGSSTIVGKSGDRQVTGNTTSTTTATTTASNANSSKVTSTNRTTASHSHAEQQGGGASIRFGTFGNRDHFGNRVPIRAVPVRANSVAPAAVTNSSSLAVCARTSASIRVFFQSPMDLVRHWILLQSTRPSGGRTTTQKSEWTSSGSSAYSTNSQPNWRPECTLYPKDE